MFRPLRARVLALLTIAAPIACVPSTDNVTQEVNACFVSMCQSTPSSSPDRALIKALMDAAGTSDCAVAGQRLPTITEIPYALRRSHITSLAAMACFTHFKRLNFYSNNVVDLSPLSGMQALESLSLASNLHLESVAPLADLPKLARLYLRGAPVHDLDSLVTGQSTLRFLDVSASTEITDDQIARFGELRTLVAQRRPNSKTMLAGLSKLTSLDLWASQLVDLEPGSFPTSLQKLIVSFTNIADGALLAPLHSLVELDVGYTDMTGFAALSGLIKMKRFTATRTRIGQDGGLGFASSWNALETIDVGEAGITDAQALAGKSHLRVANLRMNALTTTPDVSSAAELDSLLLDDNSISDVSPLVGLTWVPTIFIGHNPVTVGLCDLAGSRTGRPQTLPRYQGSPGYDHALMDAIAACPNVRASTALRFVPSQDDAAADGDPDTFTDRD